MGFVEHGAGPSATGVTLGWKGAPEGWTPPALPSRCPSCGHSETQQRFRYGVVRSPIRAHTQGIDQATQLLVSSTVRSVSSTSTPEKTIVFTDSREDAAGTAMGLAENGFADLVRQLVRRSLDREDDVVRVLRDGARPGGLAPAEMVRYEQLRQQHAGVSMAYVAVAMGLATDEHHGLVAGFEAERGSRAATAWPDLVEQLTLELVRLGVPPAGSAPPCWNCRRASHGSVRSNHPSPGNGYPCRTARHDRVTSTSSVGTSSWRWGTRSSVGAAETWR